MTTAKDRLRQTRDMVGFSARSLTAPPAGLQLNQNMPLLQAVLFRVHGDHSSNAA